MSCHGLIEVSISEGLRELGEDAFSRCKSLVSINLPSSLEVIGAMAFENCEGLIEMNITDTVETIGRKAFINCNLQNFRVPPLVTEADLSIVGGNECLVSLELSENVTSLANNGDTRTSLNSLRNIALPSSCKMVGCLEEEDAEDLWGRCKDLRVTFPNEEDTETITDALRNRFDELPIHKICYYQSYLPIETVMQGLKREINPWTSKFPGQLNTTGKQQDCLGMTPLHILACSTQQHVEMYRLLIEKYPETLIMKDKWGDIPLLYAIWCQRISSNF